MEEIIAFSGFCNSDPCGSAIRRAALIRGYSNKPLARK